MTRRAWTVRALTAAIPGATSDQTLQALESAVGAGECVRLTSAASVYYVGVSIRDALDALDVMPATADDVDVLRAGLAAQHPSTDRLARPRERVRRALQPTTTKEPR